MPSTDDLQRAGKDDSRPLVVAPRLEYLPLNELPWERYELLLRRIARDERGLRRVRLYGSRGQSQYGIDLAGHAPDGTGEAIQGNCYIKFTPADLTAAVAKFIECRPEIPFAVDRLFVAAACDSDRRQVTDELYRLAAAHPDVEIDFWDRRTQCDMLRRRRDIVLEFRWARSVRSPLLRGHRTHALQGHKATEPDTDVVTTRPLITQPARAARSHA